MGWLLRRLLLALVAMATGGLAGFGLLGRSGATIGLIAGGLIGAAGLALYERRRGEQLLTWLRQSREGPAPRDAGFWGELGYRIERALRQSELEIRNERARLSQFLSAIEASPNGVMLLDAQDQIEWLNSSAADHFGLDPLRDRRQRVTNLVRAPAFVAYLQNDRFDERVSFQAPRGSRLAVGAGAPLCRRHEAGAVDRQDRRGAHGGHAARLRRQRVARDPHAAHGAVGLPRTLANLPLSEAERKRVLAMMARQTERMGTLVHDLLTLAQLEGSPRPAADRWVDLQPLLGVVEADARALSAGRHRIAVDVPERIAIAGSATELTSAVTNLVHNAIRYTPEGGVIDVSWRLLTDGAGELAVSDTGPGIAREHLPRLTERFYRVDGSRSRETGGTGLGLSIVKHVVQRHGGELVIDSEVGKGSVFRLVFPAPRVRIEKPMEDEVADESLVSQL
jgi:two-component system phosphate regulon sensor histidine kinase PhoR